MPSRPEAAPSWILIPDLGEPGTSLDLSADEARYLARVCRVRPGERVTATDGRGAAATLLVLEVGRGVRARVEALDRAEPPRRAWVLCGCPEGRRADWLVEKLAELGIERFVPVDCARARWPATAGRPERLERLAAAGLRQSRRRWLMQVDPPTGLGAALAGLPGSAPRWWADAAGTRRASPASEGLSVGLIGPAEGLDEIERNSLAASGWTAIALADARLRCETAAVAWACWWAAGAS
jgi:16S rRNA (uracil1498-N3)-methyltransferase